MVNLLTLAKNLQIKLMLQLNYVTVNQKNNAIQSEKVLLKIVLNVLVLKKELGNQNVIDFIMIKKPLKQFVLSQL